jgi:hypothetical protein
MEVICTFQVNLTYLKRAYSKNPCAIIAKSFVGAFSLMTLKMIVRISYKVFLDWYHP